jgi:predicted small lipoprotein YifL
MKKLLQVALLAVVCATLIGCGAKSGTSMPENTGPAPAKPPTAEQPPEVGVQE